MTVKRKYSVRTWQYTIIENIRIHLKITSLLKRFFDYLSITYGAFSLSNWFLRFLILISVSTELGKSFETFATIFFFFAFVQFFDGIWSSFLGRVLWCSTVGDCLSPGSACLLSQMIYLPIMEPAHDYYCFLL